MEQKFGGEFPKEEENTPEFDPEIVGGFNPDRVKIEKGTEIIVTAPENRHETVEVERMAKERPYWAIRAYGSSAERVRAVTTLTVAASLAGTLATNIGVEYQRGASNEHLTDSKRVEGVLETVDMETLAKQTQEEVCRIVDANFMHRFITRDEDGNESLNPGGFVVPFAVAVTKDCKAKVDVNLHVPYALARTFNEIIVKNPEARTELVEKLSQFISQSVKNQLEIRGIADVTGTTYVYNYETNTVFAGESDPTIDLGKFDINNLSIEGVASAEAKRSVASQKAESLQGFNPENILLAGKRLVDIKPLIIEALQKSGVDPEVLKNAKNIAYESNLSDAEISEISAISRDVLGGVISGSEKDAAYELVEEINKENPEVIDAINANQEYAGTIDRLLFSERGVNIKFEADTQYEKTSVYNISILLPLGLLLLPAIRITRIPGETKIIRETQTIEVPDIVETKTTIEPIARRLFSETTPDDISVSRDFDEVYDNINLSERSGDTHALLQHMLIEEVLPSLNKGAREPMIDYEAIVNECREYMSSDTRKDGVKKAHYSTIEDAQRKITAELLEMWERHDAATYPMRGIDTKTVLNYRNSDKVAYWAKTLAYEFVRLMDQTQTTEEFRDLLRQTIEGAIDTRRQQGNTNRNKFVKSDFPLENPDLI